MKIPRMDTSRRPQKPGRSAAVQTSAEMTLGELGSAPGGDWFRLHVAHIAAPQGSHRQGFGKSVQETNPRTEPYRQAVADACEDFIDRISSGLFVWEPLDGHLALKVVFYMPPPPKSDPHRPFPNVAPDLDKLIRSTCDGITRGRLWKDDARVVSIEALKLHAHTLQETGVDIAVRRLA